MNTEVDTPSTPGPGPDPSTGANARAEQTADVPNSIPALGVVTKLVEILTPLTAKDRERMLSAAMLILGHTTISTGPNLPGSHTGGAVAPDVLGGSSSSKAQNWMTKNGVTQEQLDHVFAIDQDTAEIIAAKMPGSDMKEQTIEAYILTGLSSFLRNGELGFTDKDARAACHKLGCYHEKNHSRYVGLAGNALSGTKTTGWKLTNPGLARAAEIVKKIAPAS